MEDFEKGSSVKDLDHLPGQERIARSPARLGIYANWEVESP
jgi:hypothetical protein